MKLTKQQESHRIRNVLILLLGIVGLAFILGWIFRPSSLS